VDLTGVAGELYALPPGEFTAARGERAAQARAAGDRGLATAITKLRRPSASAWLVNLLVREAPEPLDRLLALGEELREAQRALAGEKLRELSRQRRQVITDLIGQARQLAQDAGQPMRVQAEREVTTTLESATADPEAARVVRTGCLLTPLYHSGLGDEGFTGAAAIPEAPPLEPGPRAERTAKPPPPVDELAERRASKASRQRQAREAGRPSREPGTTTRRRPAPAARESKTATRRPSQTAAERRARAAEAEGRRAEEAERRAAEAERRAVEARRRAAEAAQRDLHDAAGMVTEAEEALADVTRRLDSVRARRQEVRQRIEALEEQIQAHEAEETQAAREMTQARRERDSATRTLESARRRLARAQSRAAGHTPQPATDSPPDSP
jgi:DNA repair exonuclease SbcCD ATPase subunit